MQAVTARGFDLKLSRCLLNQGMFPLWSWLDLVKDSFEKPAMIEA